MGKLVIVKWFTNHYLKVFTIKLFTITKFECIMSSWHDRGDIFHKKLLITSFVVLVERAEAMVSIRDSVFATNLWSLVNGPYQLANMYFLSKKVIS